MSGRLSGKNVIIAGAGQTPGQDMGNGRAIAILFAREGANCFITARHIERAQETARLILRENPQAKVIPYALDATDEASVRRMAEDAARALGSIDILVDNIGIMMQSDRSLLTVDEKTYDAMVAVNEKTALFLIRNVCPLMKEKGGAVVLIASIAGLSVRGGGNMYNITKAGMIHMGELFASMFARDGIRVNTIVLGLVQTPMALTFNQEKFKKTREEVIRERNARVPLRGGQGTAWDTAHAALFLASDEARFITGANLPVDGGTTLMRG